MISFTAHHELPVDSDPHMNRPSSPESDLQDLGEHAQYIEENDTIEDAFEILSIALASAEKYQEEEATITCTQAGAVCDSIRQELERKQRTESIDSYTETTLGREITFHIKLKRASEEDEIRVA